MTVCPLCGANTRQAFELAHAIVYRCKASGCGLRFAEPQLKDTELVGAYRRFYYPESETSTETVYGPTPADVFGQVFHSLVEQDGSLEGKRLLDFGCGAGGLCRVAMDFGVHPTGIEFDPEARRVARDHYGVLVYPHLDALEETDAQFDLVTLWEVIEHLREPWRELARLRTRMKPGAKLIVSTPNAHGLRARLQGSRWTNYVNPTHFYYFTRAALRRVIERGGFSHAREWLLSVRYPKHGILRRVVHPCLLRMRLHGALLFMAENQPAGVAPSVRRTQATPL